MTFDEVMTQLRAMGTEQTRKTLLRHGAPESILGVKVGDMKTIVKRVKKDHKLALALFDTNVPDAMYLAGLICDDEAMTKRDLQRWVKAAEWRMVGEYTVPWAASESAFGRELALEWIESRTPHVAAAGWATLSCLVSIKPDTELDLPGMRKLLQRVVKEAATAPNRVKSTMNGFVIAVGSYVESLHAAAIDAAKKIGKVDVDVGDSDCKVPDAIECIAKVRNRYNGAAPKRKMARC
jgi:3-methyladenine DNA glycosylase AlkD